MNIITEAESISSSIDVKEFADVNNVDNALSLTEVWEYILRRKELPDNLNLDLFLVRVHERLRNVEWVVRQHALRLLKDVIPLLDKGLIDEQLKDIIEDVVVNLGHVGPAVKKCAIDCLRCYVRNSYNADNFIRNLVTKGLQNTQENKIPINVVLGIILSLPFILSTRVLEATLQYTIHGLLDRIVQIENQELIVIALVRIRCLIGEQRFNKYLATHETSNSIENFELLCKVYNINLMDMAVYASSPVLYNDVNQNFIKTTNFGVWSSGNGNSEYIPSDFDEDKVILETEIRLESGPAITMKIHEESRRNSICTTTDSEDDRPSTSTFKVLPDDNDLENYEHLRRTPRRVRFGGEIIKMRTPDSDSNVQSDDDPNRNIKPLLEIQVVENETKTTTRISKIPILVRSNRVQSVPSSPVRDVSIRRKKLYKSFPNLNKSSMSRIPRRFQTETKYTIERKIQIRINENRAVTKISTDGNLDNLETTISYLNKPKETMQPKKSSAKTSNQTKYIIFPNINSQLPNVSKHNSIDELNSERRSRSISPKTLPVNPMPRRNSREDEFSPIPIHNEIEVIYNLTRTPSPNKLEAAPLDEPEEQLNAADKTALPYLPIARNVKVADCGTEATNENDVQLKDSTEVIDASVINGTKVERRAASCANNFNSFQVYDAMEMEDGKTFLMDVPDSPIPTKDSGECLTCSSSGSDTTQSGGIKLDTIGMLDKKIVEDIQCIDDVRLRQRGLEELMRHLQSPVVCESLEERLSTLLHILFTTEQQSILQPTAEQALIILFGNMRPEALTSRLQQIALGLSKMGSPAGIRLALVLMKRISPKDLVDQLLSDNILGMKSSKVREGALQILMTISRIFPSTDTNLPKCINGAVNALKDKKRRVRQAALETVASLAQLSSINQVMDIVSQLLEQQDEFEQIVRVVRNRLSRKQLPMVDMNGSIRYSTPSGDSEMEWLQKGIATNGTEQRTPLDVPKSRTSSNWSADAMLIDDIPSTSGGRVMPVSAKSQLVPSLPQVQIEPPQIDRISGNWGSGRRFKSYSTEHLAGGSRIVGTYEDTGTRLDPSGGDRPNFWKYNSRKQMEVQRFTEVDAENQNLVWPAITGEDSTSLPTVNGKNSTANNNGHLNINNGTTQIWAIDPSIFGSADRVAASNDKFRPVYLVKSTNKPPTNNKLYSRSTNTSNSTTYSQRGRSFSPPHKLQHHRHNSSTSYEIQTDTYQNVVPERFVRTSESSYGGGGRGQNLPFSIRGGEVGLQKSYSIDNLNGSDGGGCGFMERKSGRESRGRNKGGGKNDGGGFGTSSGSSNESGYHRYAGYWGKDVRSGIPVPIYSENLRIRRNNGSTKGPMSVPYDREKPVSPNENTDTLISAQCVISRQPYSSGSDSSGYFTPPAESHLPEVQPDPPEVPPPPVEPERFIKLDSTFEDDVIPSSPDEEELDCNTEEKIQSELPEHTFDKLEIQENDNDDDDEEKYSDILDTNEVSLKDEQSFVQVVGSNASFDDVDFNDPVTFSENRALSKSEVDITRYNSGISRKNISSAPALHDFDETPITPAETLLPSEIIDDTDIPKYLSNIPSELIKPTTAERLPPKTAAAANISRRKSCRVPRREPTLFPDTLTPFSKPKDAFAEVVEQLESTEWEVTIKGLQGMVRLVRFHREIVEGQMHTVSLLIGKHIRNLRSQVSRAACLVASEIFANCRRGLETNLDDFAAPLLHRTADTNKFLRTDANAALDVMSVHVPAPKMVQLVAQRGAQHQNGAVRCASVRLICALVHRLGPHRVFLLPRETRDRIMAIGANMLMEGSLESRKHSKVMFSLLSTHSHFSRALQEAVPSNVLRHIDKTIRSMT